MKKKLLITSSLITILLALFPVSLYAEEVVQDPAPAITTVEGTLLDSYFYQNYDILPYIQSSGTEFIDTGIKATNFLRVFCKYSDVVQANNQTFNYLFGAGASPNNELGLAYRFTDNNYRIFLNNNVESYVFNNVDYVIYNALFDQNDFYLNNNLIHSFNESTYTSTGNIYIFSTSSNNSYKSICKIYNFSIYDYSADSGNGAYVRYFYPAKAKTSGTIGLYDSVSKTFFPSLGINQFSNPTDDKVLNFQIGDFISAGLTWIGDILDFVIDQPIILFFIAVGLAGAMYRWARRLVHF